MLESLLAACVGIGLSAGCGFRIFVPMLVVSLAAKADWITLSDGFAWLDTWPAVVAFAVATVLEIGAYYIPWFDNLLDTAATPAATIAGVLVSAAFVADLPPLLSWSVAIIAGGGVAGTIKTGLSGVRVGSTATTAGTANPVLSTFEWITSLAMSLLALALPILAAIVALVLAAVLLRFAMRVVRRFLGRGEETIEPARE